MGTIWIKEFVGGLDTRRMPETTPGGALIRAKDGHINSGREFEQRAAFKKAYTLPEGATKGLAAGKSSLHVFGHATTPGGMPKGVAYQRLQHPTDNTKAIARLRSADLNAGKIYSIVEFEDGRRFHYYDGTRVVDWIDGRATAKLTVDGGSVTPAASATGSFEITGGTLGSNNRILNVFVGGAPILSAPLAHTGNNTTTADALAAAINAVTTSPDYTAVAAGALITITAAAAGSDANGRAITVGVSGDATVASLTSLSGGADELPSILAELTVNSVSIIDGPVAWRTSHAATAQAVVDAINAADTTPEYVAYANGADILIFAAEPGTAYNTFAVGHTLQNGFSVNPGVGVALANGVNTSASTFQAGTIAKTIGSKMYAVAGPALQFSGVLLPDGWISGTDTGAGAIDMSSEASGAEELKTISEYQNYLAVFAARLILIWVIDPDPDQNKKVQTLRNTGTEFPHSVTQFGDQDVFYIDRSGARSLRARDASNAASTNDVGVPIDSLVKAKLNALKPEQRDKVFGLIEPNDGRLWFVFPDEIFVFSHFPGSKVTAWSTYTPVYYDDAGEAHSFTIDEAVIFKGRVYLRSGDEIIVYGGQGATQEYDQVEPEAWLPYLDADVPTLKKNFAGVDVACQGAWEVRVAMQPDNLDASDEVAVVNRTTFNLGNIGGVGESTHISLRFKGVGSGYKKLSAAVIHHDLDDKAGGEG